MNETFVPDFDVSVQGLSLAADVRRQVLDVEYDNHLDTADMFRVRLADPGNRLADSTLFSVGATVEIRMGYVGRLQPMILGEIAAIEPSFRSAGGPTLTITGYDRSQPLRHGRAFRQFRAVNDTLIAAQIAAEHGLIPMVDPSPYAPRPVVSHIGSDWALLNELADRNFFQVGVSWDRLYFRLPRPQTEQVVLVWGRNLVEFSPRVGGANTPAAVAIRGYEEKTAETIVSLIPALASADIETIIERAGGSLRDLILSHAKHVVFDQPVENFVDAATLGKAILARLLEGTIEGTGRAIGDPRLEAGQQVEIRGVGRRFGGTYTLRQVRQVIGEGGYETHFEISQKYGIGLLESLRDKLLDTPSPKKGGRPHGVVVGRVVNNADLEGLGRILLEFPEFSDVNLSAWARIASPMTGDGMGVAFLPDNGEEVLVAFEHDDPDKPVVLGGLWNGKHRPPVVNRSPANAVKLIRTRSGHEIRLDDSSSGPEVEIKHASGDSTITMAGDGSVSVQAKNGALTLRGQSIELDAGAGNVAIKANNVKVSVAGTMDVSPPSP